MTYSGSQLINATGTKRDKKEEGIKQTKNYIYVPRPPCFLNLKWRNAKGILEKIQISQNFGNFPQTELTLTSSSIKAFSQLMLIF